MQFSPRDCFSDFPHFEKFAAAAVACQSKVSEEKGLKLAGVEKHDDDDALLGVATNSEDSSSSSTYHRGLKGKQKELVYICDPQVRKRNPSNKRRQSQRHQASTDSGDSSYTHYRLERASVWLDRKKNLIKIIFKRQGITQFASCMYIFGGWQPQIETEQH